MAVFGLQVIDKARPRGGRDRDGLRSIADLPGRDVFVPVRADLTPFDRLLL